MQNTLQNENSPYLLQHAHNPVHWQTWNEPTLRQAQIQDKMILVSIGYHACHWCHVMEKECFEDEEVAQWMNNYYINIKVDREERPDIDMHMMDICQILTGSGGWPLHVLLLPNLKPVYAGTYFPKSNFIAILKHFAFHYEKSKPKLLEQAARIEQGIVDYNALKPSLNDENITPEDIEKPILECIAYIDKEHGGIQGTPKFIMPEIWRMYMMFAYKNKDEQLKNTIHHTLTKIALGSICDQIEGGFARYSVDEQWHVPHFEKMLYDNAQLISLYCEAYSFFGDDYFKKTAQQIIHFAEANWNNGEGLFYTAFDADSEGEEGKYYIETYDTLKHLLGDDFEVFSRYYAIAPEGNWAESASNIFHAVACPISFAAQQNIDIHELNIILERAKNIIIQHRQNKVKPNLDNKIITSWNAMLAKALCDGYRYFNEEQYYHKAKKIADNILQTRLKDDEILRLRYDQHSISGFLDDYAFVIDMCLNMFYAKGEEYYFNMAENLAEKAIHRFYDGQYLFYYNQKSNTDALHSKYETQDNVIPSSNAVMAEVLHRIYLINGNSALEDIARKMCIYVQKNVFKNPLFYSRWAQAFTQIFIRHESRVYIGQAAEGFAQKALQQYHPFALIAFSNTESTLPIFKNRFTAGKTLYYYCENNTCQAAAEL